MSDEPKPQSQPRRGLTAGIVLAVCLAFAIANLPNWHMVLGCVIWGVVAAVVGRINGSAPGKALNSRADRLFVQPSEFVQNGGFVQSRATLPLSLSVFPALRLAPRFGRTSASSLRA